MGAGETHRGWEEADWQRHFQYIFTQRDVSIVFIALDTWVGNAIDNFSQTIYSEKEYI